MSSSGTPASLQDKHAKGDSGIASRMVMVFSCPCESQGHHASSVGAARGSPEMYIYIVYQAPQHECDYRSPRFYFTSNSATKDPHPGAAPTLSFEQFDQALVLQSFGFDR